MTSTAPALAAAAPAAPPTSVLGLPSATLPRAVRARAAAEPKPPYVAWRRVHRIDGQPVAVTLHEPAAANPRAVPEALVQALWRQQRFDAARLVTTDGQRVRVIDPGASNRDGGPDFRNARLRIGPLTWHGDVEIHTTSGAWFDHGHHDDARYNSVVLHVTLAADVWTGGLLRADGTTLPEVVLLPRLDAPLRTLLHAFYTREDDGALPCAARFAAVPAGLRRAFIRQLGRERLHAKARRLDAPASGAPDARPFDEARALHEALFAALGYAPNAAPMTSLARRLPLDLVRRIDDARNLEALHFGVAGLLPAPSDLLEADRATADYAMDLRARFDRLDARLDLPPAMRPTEWQFFRLRPANFPTLRIAQAVALVAPGGLLRRAPVARLATAARADDPVPALLAAFDAPPLDFWATHYRLAKPTKPRDPSLGRSRRHRLVVNAVLPVLLRHAEAMDDAALREAVVAVFDRLPAGRDRVVRRFRDLGQRPASALEAQGLHRLYRAFCSAGGCLDCAIGRRLLGRAE